jgi:NAD(P)-dependent dehydrogenase (short-subunit alcohol dehydrogenase family)
VTSQRWTAQDLPPQQGRTIIITGASSGIGLVAAREFARVGATVVLAVRDTAKGERAAATIAGDTRIMRLDLADLASVRAFADAWDEPLDILVNNGGVANTPLARTKDGFELQTGTNHLGHFALTNLLLPRITGRVVTVASNAHRSGTIDLADLNWRTRPYRAAVAYAQSKLAGLLMTSELHRRLQAAASPVRALAAHPGAAATSLNRHLGPAMKVVAAVVGRLVQQSENAGAWPVLYAATQDLPGDTYVGPGGRFEQSGPPVVVGRSDTAKDSDNARKLWELSEQLTSTTFPSR